MTPYWLIKDKIRTEIGLGIGVYVGWDGANCSSKINPVLTVVSSNYTGSLIDHKIGLRFNFPFVNL